MSQQSAVDRADPSLAGLFDPDRVAVVGATESAGVGRALTENLLAKFDGEVLAVNPNRESVLGLRCYDSVAETDADVAVVAVPTGSVLDVLEACGESGVRNVIVVTAGFGEAGEAGAEREARLEALAAEYGLNVVGPNCLGVLSTPSGLNATFGPSEVLSGSISFLSQSGAFVTAVIDWATDEGIGFEDVVSLGNKAVLDETDFLRYWGADEGTDVVVGYLEDVEDGRAFIEAAREVTADTPVVVVKSGRTEAGAAAASSHTGALAGSDAAYDAGFEQAGVIREDTTAELFDAANALTGQPVPEQNGVVVVTNAGGPGVLTTDAVGDSSLSMATLDEGTQAALEDVLRDEANVRNPVDVLGDADTERFRAALRAVLDADGVGSVVVVTAPTAVLDYGSLAEMVVEETADHETTAVSACLMGGKRTEAPKATLREAGIPTYFDPARAIDGLDALARYRRLRDREYQSPATFEDVDRERAHDVLAQVREREGDGLGVESMELLSAYGIPTPVGEVVESPEAAAEVAERIGGEVVMKIVSEDISHKSDIGGVEVGVEPAEAADTYRMLAERVAEHRPDATLTGVQVQELVDTDRGVETIAGSNRDPGFGPLVLFGLGGVFVELLEDTSLRVAPVSEREAREMTEEIKTAPLLSGARGTEPADRRAIVEVLCRLSQLVAEFPAIRELDINPLVALPDGEGVIAVDLRVRVDADGLSSPEKIGE